MGCARGHDSRLAASLPLCNVLSQAALCFLPGSLIFQEVCEIALTLQNLLHWSTACHRAAL